MLDDLFARRGDCLTFLAILRRTNFFDDCVASVFIARVYVYCQVILMAGNPTICNSRLIAENIHEPIL